MSALTGPATSADLLTRLDTKAVLTALHRDRSATDQDTSADGAADRNPDSGPDGVPDSGESVRRVVLTPASSVRIRPVFWSWTDRIPSGAITVIPGREGIGKSLLLAWLTAQLTRGTLPGIHEGTPRPVIYAATEDSWSHTIAPRLIAAGADLDMVLRVEVETAGMAGQLTLPTDCDALAVEIRRLGVALLAADPLLSLIHGSIDTHNDHKLRAALEPLARLADTTGCAVVGLAHFNKSSSDDALTLITGSRAFSAVARAVIAIARDPAEQDGTCVMSQAKNNLGRLDLPSLTYQVQTAMVPTAEGPAYVGRLTFTGETSRNVGDILAETNQGNGENTSDARAERDEATAWLIEYLDSNGGEAARPDVIKAAKGEGISERTLKRVAAKAINRGDLASDRSGFPARSIYRLLKQAGDSAGGESSAPDDGHVPAEQTDLLLGQLGQLGQSVRRQEQGGLTGPTEPP